MGTRSLAAVVLACAFAGSASADPKSDVQAKGREAMEAYDLMDYDAAKKSLNQALQIAKKGKLDKDPIAAKVYLYLGIATFAGGDAEGARASFVSAVQIDPKIQIDAAYKSPELVKMLDAARTEAGGGAPPSGNGGSEAPPVDTVDCSGVKGLQHTIIDEGKQTVATPIEALVGADLKPNKVSVMWRSEGETEFTEAQLTKQGACKYTGQIPGSAMRGSVLHYYIAAYDGGIKPIATRGSQGAPNLMELGAAPPGGGGVNDGEDPINGNRTKPPPTGDNISGGIVVGGKAPKVYIAFAGGTGFGYVTGKTEFGSPVETCCIGNSLVVLQPELGFHISRQLAVGLAGRIGLPLGANIDGHSTMAPGGLIRLRYALSTTGEGIRVMGQLGGGVLRNTIKLNNAMPGMDTDIVPQGPLLVGAGVGFKKSLSGNLAFIADLSALGAIAVVDKLGTSNMNTGFGADLSIGLAVGF
jgi:hypothetical protein